jgi:putative ABC transport system permease protein
VIKNYLKMALKVLLRRKFFTAVSLFGIAFTLLVLIIAVSILDSLLAPETPEVNLDRTLHISRLIMRGGEREETWCRVGSVGYAFLDRYARGMPGVEVVSIFSEPRTVTGYAGGEKLSARMRTADGDYWKILEFRFLEGGPFTGQDDESGALVAVISRGTGRRYFGEKPALGKSIEMEGRLFRVVGVVEDVPASRLTASGEIWIPHGAQRSQEFRRQWMGHYSAMLLARSRKDLKGIKAEFASRLKHVEADDIRVAPGHNRVVRSVQGTAMTQLEFLATGIAGGMDEEPPVARIVVLFLGYAAAFLFLPTINLVSINLSRILERSAEIGVRKAFGASSVDLAGQFVVENVVVCVLGGALALAGAAVCLDLVERFGLVPLTGLAINFRVFLYAFLLAGFFGLLSGVYPAWRASRLHPVAALRGGVR